MSSVRRIQEWINADLKRRTLAIFFEIVLGILLSRLLIDVDDFLADPWKDLRSAALVGTLGSYITYSLETRRKRGQAIPDLASAPLFKWLAATLKIMLVIVVLVNLGVLITFRIENWGGLPDAADQMRMKLIGLAFLVPLSIFYLSGWWITKSNALGWSVLSWVGAIGLYFWNAVYAWRNPSTNPGLDYKQVFELLCRLPFVPHIIIVILGIFWLMMIFPRAELKNKIESIA